MALGVVISADLIQRGVEKVPNANPLANVEISKGIEMNPARFQQVLMRAVGELRPGVLPGQ